MELFPEAALAGVGLGSIGSASGAGGLIALALASGVLVATGLAGRLLVGLILGVSVAVMHDPAWAGEPLWTAVAIATLPALAIVIWGAKGKLDKRGPVIAGGLAGALTGAVWAAWDQAAVGVDEPLIGGAALGLFCGVLGVVPAMRFMAGALESGADKPEDRVVVGITLCAVALVFAAIGFFVPFAGYVLVIIVGWFAWRQRKRDKVKYKGLRILN
jgi:hypothetical protein